MKTKLFVITFFAVALWTAPAAAQVDTFYFSDDAGTWFIDFDQDTKDGKRDTFALKQSDDKSQWFFVADLDTVPGAEQHIVKGPAISTEEPPSEETPNEEEGGEKKPFNLFNFLKDAGTWVVNNWYILILPLLEILVRIIPGEKDNNLLRLLQSWLDTIIPNNKKGGGRFYAYDNKESAPVGRVAFHDEEKAKLKEEFEQYKAKKNES